MILRVWVASCDPRRATPPCMARTRPNTTIERTQKAHRRHNDIGIAVARFGVRKVKRFPTTNWSAVRHINLLSGADISLVALGVKPKELRILKDRTRSLGIALFWRRGKIFGSEKSQWTVENMLITFESRTRKVHVGESNTKLGET